MSSIGPELPPHLRHLSQRETEHEDDFEDDYTPELPPDLIQSRIPSTSASSSKPALHKLSKPPVIPSYDSDSDSDSDIGPKPLPLNALPTVALDPVSEFIAREERRKELRIREEEDKKKGPKREEWMLVPPSKGDLLSTLDPSKLTKPRQFARSTPASSSNANSSSAAGNLWTETPAERQQRLADEVMGKKRPATRVAADAQDDDIETKRRKLFDEDTRKGVHEHTRRVRGAALVDVHIAKEKETATAGEGEKELGIWDHGRDMALSGRLMDDSKRNKMIRDARSLGDRFGSGSGGGFL